MPARILITAFGDDAAFERAVFGDAGTIDMQAGAVPEASLAAADALLASAAIPVRGETIGKLARCRIVVRYGAGYDNCDGDALGAAGIALCNVPDYHRGEIADHALGLLLALRRGLFEYVERLRGSAGWMQAGMKLVRRLDGTTFGIVGIGTIGRQAARRAAAFGMQVAFHDPYVAADDPGVAGWRKVATLPELLSISDAVSLHCPLTAETRGLIDAAALAHMKPGAILVNTARGPVADVGAVVAALREGRLGGAALDVLPVEPPPADDPALAALRARPEWAEGRLIVTPHAAYYSPESLRDMRTKVARRARAYLEHGTLDHCVNRDRLDQAAAARRAPASPQA